MAVAATCLLLRHTIPKTSSEVYWFLACFRKFDLINNICQWTFVYITRMEIIAEQRLYEQVEALCVSIESDIDISDFRFFNSSSQYTTLLLFVLFMIPVWFALFIFHYSFEVYFCKGATILTTPNKLSPFWTPLCWVCDLPTQVGEVVVYHLMLIIEAWLSYPMCIPSSSFFRISLARAFRSTCSRA